MKKFFIKARPYLVMTIIFCSVFAMLWSLANGYYLFHDEGVYLTKARSWLAGTPADEFEIYRPIGMPIFGWIVLHFSDSLRDLRGVGIFFGALAILLIYLFFKKISNRWVGITAAFVAATSFLFMQQAPTFLDDIPSSACMLGLLYVIYAYYESVGESNLIYFAAPLAALAFYVRYGAVTTLAIIVALTIFILGPKFFKKRPKSYIKFWIMGLIAAILFIPHFIESLIVEHSFLGILIRAGEAAHRQYLGQGFLSYVEWLPNQIGGWVLGISAILGIVVTIVIVLRKSLRHQYVGLVWVGAMGFLSLFITGLVAHPEGRYVFFPMVLMSGVGIAGIYYLAAFRSKILANIMMIVLIFISIGFGFVYYKNTNALFESKEADPVAGAYANAALFIRNNTTGSGCAIWMSETQRPLFSWETGCNTLGVATEDEFNSDFLEHIRGDHYSIVLSESQDLQITPATADTFGVTLTEIFKQGSVIVYRITRDDSTQEDYLNLLEGVTYKINDVAIQDASSNSGTVFLPGSENFTDNAFDLNYDWNSTNTVALYARRVDSKNYESCIFSKTGTQIVQSVGGIYKQLFQGNNLVTDSSVNLGMRVIKDKIECLVDDYVVAYVYGADPSLSSGSIGARPWEASGYEGMTARDLDVSTYNTPEDYAETYDLSTLASSTTAINPSGVDSTPTLTGTSPAPAATSLQDLGLSSVFANWVAGTHSTLAADTSLYTQGNQSLSLTTDGAGDLADATVLNQGPYNLTNKYLEVWIRVSSTTNIGDLYFVASSNNLHSDSYTWRLNTQVYTTPDESEIQAGEWVPIVLTFDANGEDTVMTGAPIIAALNSFDLHISDKGSAPLTVWLGGISAVAEPPQAALTIIFDNGWSSEYSLAMPTLAKYGFPAVIAEIPETANDPDFMSTQQLQDLQNNLDWDIACHTWDHNYQLGLPTTTIAIMDSEFSQCQNWLVQNGVGKASNILVWPDGSNSPTAIAEASKYFVAARGIVGTAFNTLPVANPMMLYSTELGGTTPTSTLDADVDRCMANHEWCIFYGHIITTSTPTDQDEYASSSFNDFVAHIAQVGIPVKTMTEVLANEPNLPAPSVASLQSPSGSASNPSGLSIPYTETNFTGDTNWQRTWGTMTIVSSGVMDIGANASTTGASTILVNTEGWANYTFNATFDWIKGEEVGLIGRYIDNNDYLVCDFEQIGNDGVAIKLEQYVNGNEQTLETGTSLAYTGLDGDGNSAYIKTYGPYATCSFNGQTLTEYATTISTPSIEGGIGFTMWDPGLDNSEIVVKNVDVEPAY